ncbi:hypothetical protein HKD37_U058746 [Glycine soja]
MRSFNGDFPPWRCSGRQRRRGERRRHPLGNKPWKKEPHHQDEPWIRSLEGCFNGGKERGRERERGEHEIEGIKEGEKWNFEVCLTRLSFIKVTTSVTHASIYRLAHGLEIYPKAHENPRVFPWISDPIYMESSIQCPCGVGLHHLVVQFKRLDM